MDRVFEVSEMCLSRFPTNPIIIKVPFFLMFKFSKETPKNKS